MYLNIYFNKWLKCFKSKQGTDRNLLDQELIKHLSHLLKNKYLNMYNPYRLIVSIILVSLPNYNTRIILTKRSLKASI